VVGAFLELFADQTEAIVDLFPDLIRPPGANHSEEAFLAACQRCGCCIEACPHLCIRRYLDPRSFFDGTPFLSLRETPCRVCEGFPCITACPHGALRLPVSGRVTLGRAHWAERLCLRTQGKECTACEVACSQRFRAITGTPTGIQINTERCTGCGECERACPIQPEPAIIIFSD
jgi:ferredoxin-type protein NapG